MITFTLKRTDTDGHVSAYVIYDQDEAGRDVLAHLNTPGVAEVTVIIAEVEALIATYQAEKAARRNETEETAP